MTLTALFTSGEIGIVGEARSHPSHPDGFLNQVLLVSVRISIV